jgi:predicted alpha/beta-hydrolase family hydrolase
VKDTRQLRIAVSERAGEVAALLRRPRDARWLLVLAHGAGADMHHAFMQAMSERLAERRIASLRFQFPYMEKGRRAPDRGGVLQDTVRAAIGAAGKHAGDLPLMAGGKSMGGRMTSLAAAETGLPDVRALVFFGFPLHAAGRPSAERGEHLAQVSLPMLFLQGTRDKLAELALLRPICQQLGRAATLHEVESGDHSFHVLKRSGRTDDEALDELADSVSSWTETLVV